MEVYANPLAEMISNKDVALCSELHIANRGITLLQNFERFTNLSILWLNNNRLKSLDGLAANFRIRKLYVHCNQLKVLGDSLEHFLSLNYLTLNDNCLEDVNEVLHALRPMKTLISLDLFNNPIAQEDNYRVRMIVELPSLEVLDKRPISNEEREAAVTFHKKLAEAISSGGGMNKTGTFLTDEEIASEQERQRILKGVLARMRYHITQYRIQLELSFLEFDPRKLGMIKEDIFWEVLYDFGLEQLADEVEREALLSEYRKTRKITALSATHTMRKTMILYQKFCSDVLPKELRFVKDAWKLEANNDLSTTTKDLMTYVSTCKKKREKEEYLLKQSTLLASRATNNTQVFNTTSAIVNKCQVQHNLDPWLSAELTRVINDQLQGSKAANRSHVEAVLAAMKQHGKAPLIPPGSSVYNILHSYHSTVIGPQPPSLKGGNAGIPHILLHYCLGSSASSAYSNKQLMFGPPHTASQDESMGDFIASIPIIEWRKLNTDELSKLESRVFGDADESFDQLLRAGTGGAGVSSPVGKDKDNKGHKTSKGKDTEVTTPATPMITTDVLGLTQSAVRMSTIGTRLSTQKVFEKPKKTYFTPTEMSKTAPKRSDILIIPNLVTTGNKLLKARAATANTSGAGGHGHGHGHHGQGHSSTSTGNSLSGNGIGRGSSGYGGMSQSFDFDSSSNINNNNNSNSELVDPLTLSWSYHLAKLGMKDDVLAIALDRKQRSIAKQKAAAKVPLSPIKPSTAPGNASGGFSPNKSRKSAIPKPFDLKDITGWANTTGTLVLK